MKTKLRRNTPEEEAAIQRGIAQDPDNPGAGPTEDFARARPAREAHPDIVEDWLRRTRGDAEEGRPRSWCRFAWNAMWWSGCAPPVAAGRAGRTTCCARRYWGRERGHGGARSATSVRTVPDHRAPRHRARSAGRPRRSSAAAPARLASRFAATPISTTDSSRPGTSTQVLPSAAPATASTLSRLIDTSARMICSHRLAQRLAACAAGGPARVGARAVRGTSSSRPTAAAGRRRAAAR